ncbi:MAG: Cys-tRNA(Pro) deacylase [Eggerthellaceae bacterium]
MHKTNAMRMLDAAGIPYETASYEVDESDLSGQHVAAELHQDPDQVFKTLVLAGERNPHVVCCIPSSFELDMKKVARAAHDKRVEMIPMKTLFSVTGYIRGGCSPIGMKKEFPTFIDETAQLWDAIAISAGERGEQIIINPDDLLRFTGATFADLVAD